MTAADSTKTGSALARIALLLSPKIARYGRSSRPVSYNTQTPKGHEFSAVNEVVRYKTGIQKQLVRSGVLNKVADAVAVPRKRSHEIFSKFEFRFKSSTTKSSYI